MKSYIKFINESDSYVETFLKLSKDKEYKIILLKEIKEFCEKIHNKYAKIRKFGNKSIYFDIDFDKLDINKTDWFYVGDEIEEIQINHIKYLAENELSIYLHIKSGAGYNINIMSDKYIVNLNEYFKKFGNEIIQELESKKMGLL